MFFLPCATPNRDLIFSLMKEVILQKKKVDHTQECMQGRKKNEMTSVPVHREICAVSDITIPYADSTDSV